MVKDPAGNDGVLRKQGRPAPEASRQAVSASTNKTYHNNSNNGLAPWGVLLLLLSWRCANTLFVRTFFQPDEYFQALEPAWRLAFGPDSGAWMTWEWEQQLRSSLHPALFGLIYAAVGHVVTLLHIPASAQAVTLVYLPKVVQAVIACLGDFYTWKLAERIYGRGSHSSWVALLMTMLNPWQWYCSTRTFSNSLETTLTVAALYYWSWELLGSTNKAQGKSAAGRISIWSLRSSLFLAAIAVLLRPTNIIIWVSILMLTLTRLTLDGPSPIDMETFFVLIREIALCGITALALSAYSDRLFYGFWTFPPYKFLYFNISQSLAVFYGHMPWHYYLSQGIPLLTTTFLPFVGVALYKSTVSSSHGSASVLQGNEVRTLSFAVLTMVAALSQISHKEVRFIYPLLPILHVLAAPYAGSYFRKASPADEAGSAPSRLRNKPALGAILVVNVLLATYLTSFHQPAPISVLSFLRDEYQRIHPDRLALPVQPLSSFFSLANSDSTAGQTPPPPRSGGGGSDDDDDDELFALFLTPCHSTPWRSHLVWPRLRARALTCEPPLHTAPGSPERAGYLDEADRFYAREDAADADASSSSSYSWGHGFLAREMWPLLTAGDDDSDAAKRRGGERVPRFVVGFEGVEPMLLAFFGGGGPAADMGVRLRRVWAGWNGLFNEDWRRRGRLVVWDTGLYAGSPETVTD